jgi:rod shape-determining protein MreC
LTRLRTLLDRHRAASLLAGLALLAALFPAGPFGARVRLAGLLRPLALLQPKAPAEGAAADPRSREELLRLQARVHELEAENKSLKEFRGLRLEEKARGAKAVLASILARDRAWPERRSVLLDRGTDDGLRRGMPVVAGGSLAGFVVEAGPACSRVQLLDDPAPRGEARVGVQVLRTGVAKAEEGVLFGESRGVLLVKMLHAGAVKAGDIVVTSASDASVPAGLLVGVVASVEEDRRLQQATATVEPSADLAALRSLVVLVLPEVLPERAPRTAAGKAR